MMAFIDLVKILLETNKSCAIKKVHIAKYFLLERGAKQDYLMSVYLFVLAAEKVSF